MSKNDVDLDEYLGTDFPTGDGQESNAVKVLRDKLKAEIAARKGLEGELGELRVGERTRALDTFFTGVPPEYRDFYGDRPATPEAFAEFSGKYGHLWGQQAPASPQATVDPVQQQQAQRIQQAMSTAQQPSAAPLSEQEARRAFAGANNMAELMASFDQLAGS